MSKLPCVWKCGLIVLSLYLCSSWFTYWLWFCYQVDSVRNQCNKNIQKLMEEMHFLELVSKWCQIKGGRVFTFPGKLLSANSSNQNFIGRLSIVPLNCSWKGTGWDACTLYLSWRNYRLWLEKKSRTSPPPSPLRHLCGPLFRKSYKHARLWLRVE